MPTSAGFTATALVLITSSLAEGVVYGATSMTLLGACLAMSHDALLLGGMAACLIGIGYDGCIIEDWKAVMINHEHSTECLDINPNL